MNLRNRKLLSLFVLLFMVSFIFHGISIKAAQSDLTVSEINAGAVFDFSDAVQPSTTTEEIPWIENVVASYYGRSSGRYWGGYGNRLHPGEEYFVALPASTDGLDVLGGKLGCRVSRCGDTQPELGQLMEIAASEGEQTDFSFWLGEDDDSGNPIWAIEGDEGDGLFRVLEIKVSGTDGPVVEAYVGDVGPWNQTDPYWATNSRPDAEDGVDSRGRHTNGAGIDISWALAQELGCTGLLEIDWRWKMVDGKYVVQRRPTEWRW
ncbi:MAG TPA: hypothetical protein VGB30_00350 [bacterium]